MKALFGKKSANNNASVMGRSRRLALAAIAATALSVALPQTAYAGCNVTVKVKNTGSHGFTVVWDKSKVKSKGGLWKKLARNSSEYVPAGAHRSINYTATFNCNAKRRYQVRTTRGGSTKTTYFPGPSGWTQNQSVTVNVNM